MRFGIRVSMSVLALCLGGCITEKAVLTNDQGETKTCETKGHVGIISPIRVYERQHHCINDAKAAGYKETSAPAG